MIIHSNLTFAFKIGNPLFFYVSRILIWNETMSVYIHSANIGTIEKVRGIIHPTLPESFYVKTFFSLVSLGNKKKN